MGLYGVPEHMFFHALTLAQRYPNTGAGEGMMMMRQSRLSVSPVSDAEWAAILALAD